MRTPTAVPLLDIESAEEVEVEEEEEEEDDEEEGSSGAAPRPSKVSVLISIASFTLWRSPLPPPTSTATATLTLLRNGAAGSTAAPEGRPRALERLGPTPSGVRPCTNWALGLAGAAAPFFPLPSALEVEEEKETAPCCSGLPDTTLPLSVCAPPSAGATGFQSCCSGGVRAYLSSPMAGISATAEAP